MIKIPKHFDLQNVNYTRNIYCICTVRCIKVCRREIKINVDCFVNRNYSIFNSKAKMKIDFFR